MRTSEPQREARHLAVTESLQRSIQDHASSITHLATVETASLGKRDRLEIRARSREIGRLNVRLSQRQSRQAFEDLHGADVAEGPRYRPGTIVRVVRMADGRPCGRADVRWWVGNNPNIVRRVRLFRMPSPDADKVTCIYVQPNQIEPADSLKSAS